MINPLLSWLTLMDELADKPIDLKYIELIDQRLREVRSAPLNEDRMPDQDEYKMINFLISKRAEANYILYSAKNF